MAACHPRGGDQGRLLRPRAHLRDRASHRRRDFGTMNLLAAKTHGEFSPAASSGPDPHLRPARFPARRPVPDPLPLERGNGRARRRGASVQGLSGTATAVYETPGPPAAARSRSTAPRLGALAVAGGCRDRILGAAALAGLALWLLVRPSGLSAVARLAAYVDPAARAPRSTTPARRGCPSGRPGASTPRRGACA